MRLNSGVLISSMPSQMQSAGSSSLILKLVLQAVLGTRGQTGKLCGRKENQRWWRCGPQQLGAEIQKTRKFRRAKGDPGVHIPKAAGLIIRLLSPYLCHLSFDFGI